jgi:Transposase DDE domain
LKPKTCPRWLDHATFAALPAVLVVREVRYQVRTPGFRTHQITLVTTLLDTALYRADDLAALYGTRWEVETHLGQLKTTMHMDVLHGNTVLGVLKELTVVAIIYNVVRLVISQSARLQQVDAARISVLDALRWLRTSHTSMPLSALLVNPARPQRGEPRVKKRRPTACPFRVKPRHELRHLLILQPLGA